MRRKHLEMLHLYIMIPWAIIGAALFAGPIFFLIVRVWFSTLSSDESASEIWEIGKHQIVLDNGTRVEIPDILKLGLGIAFLLYGVLGLILTEFIRSVHDQP